MRKLYCGGSEQLEYSERFLKCKATNCGSISTVFSSVVLLCVSSIIIMMMVLGMLI